MKLFKPMFVDIKTALKSMWTSMAAILFNASQVLLFVSIGTAMVCGFGYCLVNWPLQTIVVIIMGLLTFWFIMELDCAIAIRKYEEQHRENS